MAAKRNLIIELMRFVLSLFVVGYHTRSVAAYGGNSLFEYGYFAVEFFFVLSGFLLAGSLERAYAAERRNVLADTGRFMWKKVRSLLPFHIVALVLVVIVLGAYDAQLLADRLESGWTGIFFLQSAVVWTTCEGIIMPEWYLSTMLLVMLIIYPCAVLLGRKIKNKVWIPVILIAGLAVIAVAVGFGVQWQFTWNFSVDLRGFGEICLGMLCYYLCRHISGKTVSKGGRTALAVIEGVCYAAAFVLMCLPFDLMGTIGIPLVIILAAVAITISFSGHGIPSDRLPAKLCALLGAVSLPLYMLHPVVIELAGLAFADLPSYATVLICFVLSLALTAACYAAYTAAKRAVRNRKKDTPAPPPVEESASADGGSCAAPDVAEEAAAEREEISAQH